MMKKKRGIRIAVVTIGILGLAIAYGSFRLHGGWDTSTSRAEFEEVVESTNLDTRGAAYYRGRKDGYDYFRATWNVGAKNMKIPVSESPVTESFPYTKDERLWSGGSFMGMSGTDLSRALEVKLNKRAFDWSVLKGC